MAGERFVVPYDRFEKEFGSLGARAAGMAGPGWFHALNMQRYRNGFIGPRSGLRAYVPTGVDIGLIRGFGWAGTAGVDIWYVQGTNVRLMDSADFADVIQTATGALASTPTRPVQGVEGPASRVYLANYADKCYFLDLVAKTVTAIATTPGASAICFYGERLMAGGDATNPNRLYYSGAATYTTWSAANFIDVGDAGGQIRFLFPQRGHLVIGKQDGTWWVLTGVPGVNDTLRRVTGGGVHPWHLHANSVVGLGNDTVKFVPLSSGHPATFDGVGVTEEPHLDFLGNLEVTPASELFVRAARGFRKDEYVIVGGSGSAGSQGKALLHRLGSSTFHDFDQNTEALVSSDAQGHIFICDGGGAAANPKFWVWDIHQDRPAFTTDGRARDKDGDAASVFDAFLHLPEWWEPQEREVLVRSITVDFIKWNTGSSQTNAFTVRVDRLDHLNTSGVVSSFAQSFTEAVGSAATTGTPQRQVFTVGDQGVGTGFQVKLTAIRGVSIRRVAVECIVEGSRLS